MFRQCDPASGPIVKSACGACVSQLRETARRVDASQAQGYVKPERCEASAVSDKRDVVIAGGGMVGLTLGLALKRAGLEVTVVDAAPPAEQLAPNYDGRASAIAFASFRMWRAIGVGDRLQGQAQPIEEIVVSDGRPAGSSRRAGPSGLYLHFDRRELDERPEGEALGYMVENRRIRLALHDAAREAGLDLRAPLAITGHEIAPGRAEVRLADGSSLTSEVLVAADGRDSKLRKASGVRTFGWRHQQTALVVTVAHERDHRGIAHEFFLPGGPFAILPLTDKRCNVVWTEVRATVEALLALPEPDFLLELSARFGDFLGRLELAGPRFSYPLAVQLAERPVAPGMAFVGDSAHAVHPIAGQGLNMGLRDAAALAEVLVDAARLGLDLGAPATLDRYARWRSLDNATLAWATEGFNALFSNDLPGLRQARDLGMAAVSSFGPARRFFMRAAGGGMGDLPRLLKGEALVL